MVDWATYARRNALEQAETQIRITNDNDSTVGIFNGYQPEVEETDSKVASKPSTI